MTRDWYYRSGNSTRGPISSAELKRLTCTGEIQPDHLVRKDGASDWVPASKVKGLFPAPPPLPADSPGLIASRAEPPAGAGAPVPETEFAFDTSGPRPSAARLRNRANASGRGLAVIGGGCLIAVLIAIAGVAWIASRQGGARPGSGRETATSAAEHRTAEARAELLAVAEKMEGGLARAVDLYVCYVEEGGWSWSTMDEAMAPWKWTPETVAAYRKWRAAMLAAPWKPPPGQSTLDKERAQQEKAERAAREPAKQDKKPDPKLKQEPKPERKPEPKPAPAKRIPVYQTIFSGDCLVTTSQAEVEGLQRRNPGVATPNSGSLGGIIGYAFADEQPGSTYLRRYRISGKKHLMTTEMISDRPGYEENLGGAICVPAKAGPGTRTYLAFKRKDGGMYYAQESDTEAMRKKGYTPTGDRFFLLDRPAE